MSKEKLPRLLAAGFLFSFANSPQGISLLLFPLMMQFGIPLHYPRKIVPPGATRLLNGVAWHKKEISMFMIWRGWGILLPLGVVLGAFIGMLVATSVLGPQSNGLMPAIVIIFATLGAYVVMSLLARSDKGKVVIDKESGEEILLKRGDSFFFIPLRFWFYLMCVLSVISVVIAIATLLGG